VKLVATLMLDIKYTIGIALMAALLITLALVQGVILCAHVVKIRVRLVKVDILFFLVLYLLTIIGHEALHVVFMKFLGVDILCLKLIMMFKVVPIALMIMYDEISLSKYMLVSLAP